MIFEMSYRFERYISVCNKELVETMKLVKFKSVAKEHEFEEYYKLRKKSLLDPINSMRPLPKHIKT